MARKARLIAERDDKESIRFPEELLGREGEPDVTQLMESERRLFDVRRSARLGQKAQLRERISQFRKECDGYTAQVSSKVQEISFINRELDGAHTLWQKNLMPISKLTELERNATRIEGERGQFVAALAQANGKIAETELEILQVDLNFGSEVGKELREIQAKLGELAEQKIAAVDLLTRLDIRAPQDGIVHESDHPYGWRRDFARQGAYAYRTHLRETHRRSKGVAQRHRPIADRPGGRSSFLSLQPADDA